MSPLPIRITVTNYGDSLLISPDVRALRRLFALLVDRYAIPPCALLRGADTLKGTAAVAAIPSNMVSGRK